MIRLTTDYERAIAMAAIKGLQTLDSYMGGHEKPIFYPTVAGAYMMAGNVLPDTMWAVAEQLELTGADLVDYSDMTPAEVEKLREAASRVATAIRTQYGHAEPMLVSDESESVTESEEWNVGK